MANGAQWLAPASTREVVAEAAQVSNLLLRLYHYLPETLIEKPERKGPELGNIARAGRSMLEPGLLGELAKRRRACFALIGRLGYRFVPGTRLRLTSELTCGLATPNLTERGMALLRPYGLPLLPGSAVKGAIAAHLAEALAGKLHLSDAEREQALAGAGLQDLFGYGPEAEEPGKPSDVVFFDALPESAGLRVEITTPHHARYYQGREQAATGFEMPNPLPFLAVAAGAIFEFPIAVRRDARWTSPGAEARSLLAAFEIRRFDTLEGFLADALASTGKYKGFGAQTNVGYGRFERF